MFDAMILGVVAAHEYAKASTANSERNVEESILIMRLNWDLESLRWICSNGALGQLILMSELDSHSPLNNLVEILLLHLAVCIQHFESD